MSLRRPQLSVSPGGDHCRAQVNSQTPVDRASTRTTRRPESPAGGLSARLLLSQLLSSAGGQEEAGSQEQEGQG